MDLAHHGYVRPIAGGGQGRALAGEAGPDDQDVVCWHCVMGWKRQRETALETL
jgi:hypothetical protein